MFSKIEATASNKQKVPRVNVTFEDRFYAALEAWSSREYRSIASLVVYLTAEQLLGKSPEVPKDIVQMVQAESTLDPAAKQSVNSALVTAWGKLIDGEPLSPEEEELIAESCDRAPHNVHNLVKKIRSMGA